MPVICGDWAIVLLEPEPRWELFEGTTTLIRAQLEMRGYEVRQISRCAMGTTLVRFVSFIDRDIAVRNSPYFVGDTVMRVIEQNKGTNHRSATFSHDVWLTLLNYPTECWDLDTIFSTFTPYGRFLVWNRDDNNKD